MTIKSLRAKFQRNFKDNTEKPTDYDIPISSNFAMTDWLSKRMNEDNNKDDGCIDNYEDSDFIGVHNFEYWLDGNDRGSHRPFQRDRINFGDDETLSETEWTILACVGASEKSQNNFDAFLHKKKRLDLSQQFGLSQQSCDSITNRFLNSGRTKTCDYYTQRTAKRLLRALAAPLVDTGDNNGCTSLRGIFLRDKKKKNLLIDLSTQQDDIEIKIEDNVDDDDESILGVFDADTVWTVAAKPSASESRKTRILDPITANKRLAMLESNTMLFTKHDQETFDKGKWLNDAAISVFFKVLQMTQVREGVFFLNSYFMNGLLPVNDDYDYCKIQNSYANFDLSTAESILVPINLGEFHWIIAHIVVKTKQIYIMDSGKYIEQPRVIINGVNMSTTKAKKFGLALLYFMEDRAKSEGKDVDIKKWSIVDKYCPQQLNGSDCGVSLCLIALLVSEGLELNYNDKFLGKRRAEILSSIILRKRSLKKTASNNNERDVGKGTVYQDISINATEVLTNYDSLFAVKTRYNNVHVQTNRSKQKPKTGSDNAKQPRAVQENTFPSNEYNSPSNTNQPVAVITSTKEPLVKASGPTPLKTPNQIYELNTPVYKILEDAFHIGHLINFDKEKGSYKIKYKYRDTEEADEEEVTRMLNEPTETQKSAIKLKKLHITDYDMKSLEPDSWLNDTVVSSFLSILKFTEKNQNPKKTLFLSSYVVCKLMGVHDEIHNNVYNFADANRLIRKNDLFAASVIYVPIILECSHWILGCIYPRECRIELFDSGKWIANHLSKGENIDTTRAKCYGMALLYLMEDRAKYTGSIFDTNQWSIIDKYCPQQRNTWDCGVSVCLIAFLISNDLPLNYNHIYV